MRFKIKKINTLENVVDELWLNCQKKPLNSKYILNLFRFKGIYDYYNDFNPNKKVLFK